MAPQESKNENSWQFYGGYGIIKLGYRKLRGGNDMVN